VKRFFHKKDMTVLKFIFILTAVNFIFYDIAWGTGTVTFSPPPDVVYAPENKAVVSRNTTVAIDADIRNSTIHYTTDGSIPTAAAMKYAAPITITSDTTIKAMAFSNGKGVSPVSTISYIVYSSPYDISSITTDTTLTADFIERDTLLETKPARKDWYKIRAFSVRSRYWGPKAKQFPDFRNPQPADKEWLRRRIIAVASRYINSQYQYHYLINWDPPRSWPMNPLLRVRLGHQSQGTDSSNFASWVYNFGLGIEFTGYIVKQARMSSVRMPDGSSARVRTIKGKLFKPDFSKLTGRLKMGDLIYINSDKDKDTAEHVAIWAGKDLKTGEWLVIDCYDTVSDMADSAGNYIPTGVQIRPFREDSFYYKGFVAAVRIISD
jgi:hypothetical protein